MNMAKGWRGRSLAKEGSNTKIQGGFRTVDIISIPKSKWISLRGRVERIGRGNNVRAFLAGIDVGILLMAYFGFVYSDTETKFDMIIGKEVQIQYVYLALLFGTAFGLVTILIYYYYQGELVKTKEDILSEMKD
jgi:hypothetical protein